MGKANHWVDGVGRQRLGPDALRRARLHHAREALNQDGTPRVGVQA
jgi:hypothetical protein